MTEKTLWDLEALIKTDNKQLGFVIARKVDQSQGLPETDAKDRLGLGAEAPTYKPQLTSTTSKSQKLHRQIPKTPSPCKNDSAEGDGGFRLWNTSTPHTRCNWVSQRKILIFEDLLRHTFHESPKSGTFHRSPVNELWGWKWAEWRAYNCQKDPDTMQVRNSIHLVAATPHHFRIGRRLLKSVLYWPTLRQNQNTVTKNNCQMFITCWNKLREQ